MFSFTIPVHGLVYVQEIIHAKHEYLNTVQQPARPRCLLKRAASLHIWLKLKALNIFKFFMDHP